MPGWQLSSQLNHVARRLRAATDLRAPIADSTTLDLTLRSTREHRGWNLSLSVRNLFNADVREPSQAPGTAIPGDLPMAPRTFYLTTTYAL